LKKKRGITKEKKQLKEQKDEAERFTTLQEERQDLKKKFFLWQLYQAEKDLKEHQELLETLQNELTAARKKHSEVDAEVKEKKQIIRARSSKNCCFRKSNSD